ncbi:MAG: DoxX family protein, partial [Cellulomonas sp.]|nr:DoxX family protein [Cellulomonas sp.]
LRERPALDNEARRERRERLVRAVAFTGGALLAGADYEGRPGVAWRVAKAREEHASAAQ